MTTETFSTPGAGTFTVPEDIELLTVVVHGAGGGAGSASGVGSLTAGAGAGGGGSSISDIVVTPGQVINYFIGAGGVGTTAGQTGSAAGGDTWFVNATTLMAKGGARGNQNAIGAGGAAASGFGTTKFSGGSGRTNNGQIGGGGGGGAGDTANGVTSVGSAGGAGGAPDGGAGGNGGPSGNSGSAGAAPGGGGGGGGAQLGSLSGAGGNGRIEITYEVPPPASYPPIEGYRGPRDIVVRRLTGVVTGETSLLMYSNRELFDGRNPAIIYFHGMGASDQEPHAAFTSYTNMLPAMLASQGFIVLSSLWGSTTNFGNATAVTKVAEAYAWLMANGAKSGKVGVYCTSMGFMTASNWMASNPSVVGCVLGGSPLTNATNVYADNPGTIQTNMNGAYSGNFTANGTGRSPHNLIDDLPRVPGRFFYSDLDSIVRAADCESFADAMGWEGQMLEPAIPTLTGGHAIYAAQNLPRVDVIDMFHAALR
jgi:hypothetical protein